jgi:hypothetical protein
MRSTCVACAASSLTHLHAHDTPLHQEWEAAVAAGAAAVAVLQHTLSELHDAARDGGGQQQAAAGVHKRLLELVRVGVDMLTALHAPASPAPLAAVRSAGARKQRTRTRALVPLPAAGALLPPRGVRCARLQAAAAGLKRG